MGIFDTVRSSLTAAVTGLTDTITKTRASVTALRQKRADIEAAFIARDELETRIAVLVQQRGDHWMNEWGSSLLYGDQALPQASVTRNHVALRDEGQLMSFPAFCAADPEAASGLLRALLDRAGYVPGITAAARAAELARLARELEDLETTEERLIDEAIAAGVTIAHRPDVVQRRQAEARKRQLQEQHETEQHARQDRLNRRSERRAVESDYLTRGRQD